VIRAVIALGRISGVAFPAHSRDARPMPDSAPGSALVRDASSVPESPGAPMADGALRAAPGAAGTGVKAFSAHQAA